MRFERFLAHRFFRSRKRTGFVSLITWISVGGVALGVAVLILALSIMNGVTEELSARLLGNNAALILLRFDGNSLPQPDSVAAAVRQVDKVTGVAPFVYGKGAVKAGGRLEFGVIKGVDLQSEQDVTTVADNVFPPLTTLAVEEGEMPLVVIGRELAQRMRVSVGDEVMLINPLTKKPSILGFQQRVKRFQVGGIFHSGLYEYDATLMYIDLPVAQSFFATGSDVTAIAVSVEDPMAAAEMEDKVLQALGGFPFRINTWIELNENLFAYMKLEKFLLGMLLLLIVLIAAFNIVGALTMLVMEKKTEIGILKAMGGTDNEILRIFVTSGIEIGLLGIFTGGILGLAATWILGKQKVPIPNDVYFLDTIPVRLDVWDVAWVSLAVFVMCWLATLYPAWKAARLDPLEAIRQG